MGIYGFFDVLPKGREESFGLSALLIAKTLLTIIQMTLFHKPF